MVNAVVLASASNDGKLAECDDAKYEALISIRGKPMVSYVLDVLRACKEIDMIILVCPREVSENICHSIPNLVVVEGPGKLLGNLNAGLARLDSDKPALIVAGDIPLLTCEAVNDLLAQAKAYPGELHFPVIRKEVCESKFPGIERTYLRISDGTVTSGNIVLTKPSALKACGKLLDQAIATRKKPWMMASVLGIRLIIKFLMKRLSIRDLEIRLESTTGVKARGLISNYPEIAFDVDKPKDLQYVQRILNN
ncbi:MAG: NTP transferase domain-containing protein [Firmicutes bacterium]|jgi:GTP:adenosylcobinamide-phosphate guanylyltransferase|nr:NTP transferase domain-containing protein [Bacillota bacterium]